MALQAIGLGSRSNPARESAAARLINCYAEEAGPEGKIELPVYACDGFASFASLTGVAAGVTRGLFNLDDTTLYVVTGTRLQRVATNGAVTQMQELATSGYAYFARNRKENTPQVALVTSDGLFRIIENNAVSTPTLDLDIPSTLFNSCCSIDGYIVITLSNGEFYITDIDEATTIDDLNFATAQSNPDGLTRGVVRSGELVLAGPRSIEFWANTGAGDFPFERVQSVRIGLYAPASMVPLVAALDDSTSDTVAFAASNVDGDYIGVMLLGGYEGRKISPPALDRLIVAATKANIRGFQYTTRGTTFYCITDGATFSWEYNCRTGFWHERRSSGLDFWRVAAAESFNNGVVFGDYTAASLYRLSSSITPSSASQVTLRHSNNAGATWSSARTKPIGGSGATSTRVKFNRLGQSKEDGKVFEIAISNAVVENSVGNPMTIIPPTVHAWPREMRFHTVYVDTIPGVSLTSSSKGVTGLAVDVEVLV